MTGLVSRPYIDLTLALMRHFGANVTGAPRHDGTFTVRPGRYRATALHIEPDASTASYFFAAAAVTGRTVTVPGLGRGSLQGDLRFVDVLRRTGARVDIAEHATTVTGTGPLRGGFTVDMGEISDTFMTLAAIAPLADAPVTVRGIGHARLKESDRIEAIAGNLGRWASPPRPGRTGSPSTPAGRGRPRSLPARPPDRDGLLRPRPAGPRTHPRRPGLRHQDLPRIPHGTAALLRGTHRVSR